MYRVSKANGSACVLYSPLNISLDKNQVTTVTGSGPRISVFLRIEQETDEKERIYDFPMDLNVSACTYLFI